MKTQDIKVGRKYKNSRNQAVYLGIGSRIGWGEHMEPIYENKRLVIIEDDASILPLPGCEVAPLEVCDPKFWAAFYEI